MADLTLDEAISMVAEGYEAEVYGWGPAVDILAEKTGWPLGLAAEVLDAELAKREAADDWRPLRDEQRRWTL
ncbi:hypothetical protein [Actinomadura litoris]|uniref:Uncharacterized protein n=1 Tax=Actinomadura litoris TaxID=2678616 RepID=A0A7K1LB70_9ACTN|nr:hypothetical protein [Actinomadura litoris]MUN41496.1 hypothetical protein [Actinomadura litoris]